MFNLDAESQLCAMKTREQLNAKVNVKRERIKVGVLPMPLVPLKYDGDPVEYEVISGRSRANRLKTNVW